MSLAKIKIKESFTTMEAAIDRESSTIHNVKLCGSTSRNGNDYPLETLKESADKYRNVPVYLNHAQASSASRQYNDRIGNVINPRIQEGTLRGDIKFNPKHPAIEQVLWDVENKTAGVGMSHVAEVKFHLKNGRKVIESIVSVRSVDIVDGPATTQTFSEQDHEMSLAEITLEQLKSERPDLVKLLEKPVVVAEDTTTSDELKKVKEQLDLTTKELEQIKQVAKFNTEITEAGLVANEIPESILKLIGSIQNENERKVALQDFAKIKESSQSVPKYKSPEIKIEKTTTGKTSAELMEQDILSIK